MVENNPLPTLEEIYAVGKKVAAIDPLTEAAQYLIAQKMGSEPVPLPPAMKDPLLYKPYPTLGRRTLLAALREVVDRSRPARRATMTLEIITLVERITKPEPPPTEGHTMEQVPVEAHVVVLLPEDHSNEAPKSENEHVVYQRQRRKPTEVPTLPQGYVRASLLKLDFPDIPVVVLERIAYETPRIRHNRAYYVSTQAVAALVNIWRKDQRKRTQEKQVQREKKIRERTRQREQELEYERRKKARDEAKRKRIRARELAQQTRKELSEERAKARNAAKQKKRERIQRPPRIIPRFQIKEGYARVSDLKEAYSDISKENLVVILRDVPRQNGGPNGQYADKLAFHRAVAAWRDRPIVDDFEPPSGQKTIAELRAAHPELRDFTVKKILRNIPRTNVGSRGQYADEAAFEAAVIALSQPGYILKRALRKEYTAKGIQQDILAQLLDGMSAIRRGKEIYIKEYDTRAVLDYWLLTEPKITLAAQQEPSTLTSAMVRDAEIRAMFPLITDEEARQVLIAVPKDNRGPYGLFVDRAAAETAFAQFAAAKAAGKTAPDVVVTISEETATIIELAEESGLPRRTVSTILAKNSVPRTKTPERSHAHVYDTITARAAIVVYKESKRQKQTGIEMIEGVPHVTRNYIHEKTGLSPQQLDQLLAPLTGRPNTYGYTIYPQSEVDRLIKPILDAPQVDKETGILTTDDGIQIAPVDVIRKILDVSTTRVHRLIEGMRPMPIRGISGMVSDGFNVAEVVTKHAVTPGRRKN